MCVCLRLRIPVWVCVLTPLRASVCTAQFALGKTNSFISRDQSPVFVIHACMPESEITLKVLFVLWACAQSFPSRVLSPPWTGITTNDQAAWCVYLRWLQVWFTADVFIFSPSCNRQMLSHSSHIQTAPSLTHTHTHTRTDTHSLTLRHTWQRQILLDASIKRKSLCFVSTVAVVEPNSSILSSSISHGCEIREMETAFAARSKKIFKVSSWGF